MRLRTRLERWLGYMDDSERLAVILGVAALGALILLLGIRHR